MHLLASLHAPSQNQARHHISEKPRRRTMEKRYKPPHQFTKQPVPCIIIMVNIANIAARDVWKEQ